MYYISQGISSTRWRLLSTGDAGCEFGGGVSCTGGGGKPAQYFLGYMVYTAFGSTKICTVTSAESDH